MPISRTPQFVIKISKYCNLRCDYCYEYPHLGNKARMSLEQLRALFENIAASADELSLRELNFIWHGGEPFLVPIAVYERIDGPAKGNLRQPDQVFQHRANQPHGSHRQAPGLFEDGLLPRRRRLVRCLWRSARRHEGARCVRAACWPICRSCSAKAYGGRNRGACAQHASRIRQGLRLLRRSGRGPPHARLLSQRRRRAIRAARPGLR